MAKILVIDDYLPVLDILSIFLLSRGHEVITAADGPAGLQLCERHFFDLALLDMDMPGMDGIAVCTALKRHPDTRHLPVLMMTGRPGLDADRRAKGAGALEVIDKPFEVQDFLEKIARHAIPPGMRSKHRGRTIISSCVTSGQ